MAKTITRRTSADVHEFINALPDERKLKESLDLLNIISQVTGLTAYMWGPSIIGFGNYHYKYDSGHEGDAPLAGFSPRKSAFSVYIESNFPGRELLLQKLGKYKSTVACLYIKSLADVDIDVVKELILASIAHTQKRYPEE